MLDRIISRKKNRLKQARLELPLEIIMERLAFSGQPKSFITALSQPDISIIAEIKRASPTKGEFNINADIAALAKHYQAGGAKAVSVLTEEDFFLGSGRDLVLVKNTVDLPVLRKDFILEPYQLYESRLLGADAVLLIVGLLSEKELRDSLTICKELGMAALVETRGKEEIRRALDAGAQIVGINNRNLSTFETSLSITIDLAAEIPKNVLLVSESGIHTAEDVRLLKAAGVSAFLVGEALVCSSQPAAKIRELRGAKENGQS